MVLVFKSPVRLDDAEPREAGKQDVETDHYPGVTRCRYGCLSQGHCVFYCSKYTDTTPYARRSVASGSRYFDLRPVISGGVYKAGHYSYIDALNSWQGGNGQTIAEIIQQINAFTASNKELIILNLSHDYNTDAGNDPYRSFTQAEWDALFEQLAGLSNLWVAPGDPTTVDLTTVKLNNFIGGGRAAVVVIVEPSGIDRDARFLQVLPIQRL